MAKPRWKLLAWPLAGVAAGFVLAVFWIWTGEAEQRQERVVRTILVGVAAGGLCGLWTVAWLLWLSRLAWRVRLALLGLLAALGLMLGATLRVRGVTGDAMPILTWRWVPEPGTRADAIPSATPSAALRSPQLRIRSDHDYPQFLGPTRDASVSGVRLARDWPARPEPIWRRPIGAGWSGFAVAGDLAVTQEQRGAREAVACYELRTGALRWIHTDDVRWDDPLGGPGPRATPTIRDGRIYTLGATGLLNALDLATGEPLWSIDVLEDNAARAPAYGVATSPLVVGDLVVVLAGGPAGKSLVAYDRDSGRRAWSGGDDPAGYGSPVLVEMAGMRQIVVLTDRNVVAHDPTGGNELWRYPWPAQENVSQPLALPDDRLFLSSGYGFGSKLLALEPATGGGLVPEVIWESQALKAKFANVVHRDGYLYGLDDGILACVGVDDGRRRWKGGRYGHGQLLLVGDLLLVLGEKGIVALVEASPEAYRELAAFPAIDGKTWNHPALAGTFLLVRNDREAACYRLPVDSI